MNERYFAKCRHGIESVAAVELKRLGATDISPGFAGLFFNASRSTLYSIIYNSLIISRVLVPFENIRATDAETLYKNSLKLRWEDLFSTALTFMINSTINNSGIKNSHFAALKLKDSIVDRLRERTGARPDIDRNDPDIVINLNIKNNFAEISLDATGHPMHKRGYRGKNVKATLNETLAAAILEISEWNGDMPLYDPMAGSGTILAEALYRIKKIPSGFLRKKFSLFHFPDFDKKLWEETKKSSESEIKSIEPGLISGSDIDKRAVSAARKNLSELPDGKKVKITKADFEEIDSLKNHMIITNLPYGKRLYSKDDQGLLYKKFGDFLKKKCTGSKAFLLCGSTELVKKIGLRTKRKIPFFNGPIEVRLIELDLY